MVGPGPSSSEPRQHKRNSSQWIPDSGFSVPNPVEIIRTKSHRVVASRTIQPNHLVEEEKYNQLPNYKWFPNNSISTTKYSIISFVPLNIWHQLRTRYANLYFFFIAALNFCPELAVFNKWLALIPPMFVIGTTMLKDGIEDIRRWKFDNEINSRFCQVWDKSLQRFRKMQWKYILVGDIVHVSNDQDIPADLLFIRSSNEEGTCFVETANLDGETSLKQRHVPHRYQPFSGEESGFTPSDFKDTLCCEKPDKAIYQVRASIQFGPDLKQPIQKENMLLRGSKLKNTTFIEGVVMYAGHDTKVMMNNGRAPHKISNIEKITNRFIIGCCLMLAAMVISGAILSAFFLDRHQVNGVPNAPYFDDKTPPPWLGGLLGIGFFIICYQVLVPISLYITVEIIKLGQIYFISQDIELYDAESDFGINCRSLNIPEELGQITHVLSDKTGTLTENKMIFRNCAVDDFDYGGEFENFPEKLDPAKPVVSLALQERINTTWLKDSRLKHFFMNILVNNSVVVNKTPHKDMIEVGHYQEGVYSIGNASFYDVSLDQFLSKQANLKSNPKRQLMRLELRADSCNCSDDETVVDTVVDSIISRRGRADSPGESTVVSIVVSRVSSSMRHVSRVVRKNVVKPIVEPIQSIWAPGTNDFMKTIISPEDFCQYEAESPDELALIQGAELYKFRLVDRTGTHVTISRPDANEKKLAIKLILPFDSDRKRMSVIIENGKNLIMYTKGADSSMLNRIIDGSDNQIATLKDHLHKYSCRGLRTLAFGMRKMSRNEFEELNASYQQVQMDTTSERESMLSQLADKYEKEMTLLGVTGIEDRLQDDVDKTICAMRDAGMQVWVLTGDKLETAENIARASGLFSEEIPVFRIHSAADVQIVPDTEGYSLVLSTEAVSLVQEGYEPILKILKKSSSVLCYRMTPSEKASVVKTVQQHLKGKVLAIGDGANDVPMIQAAHVGIGIKGKEGMQAVMACDFAISRFRFLHKLLLVHGHWCYDRLALSFLYFLYKNTNCVFVLFFYQFYDGYSGAYTIDPTYSVLYPIIFTAVQPIIVGVLDQDHPKELLLREPEKYQSGIAGTLYTNYLFILNVLDGIWQAAIIYYICHLTLTQDECSIWTFGYYLATGMMLVNSLHLALEIRCWTTMLMLVFAFFFTLHFGYFFIISWLSITGMVPDTPTHIAAETSADSRFWFCQIIIVIVSLLPRFFIRIASNSGIL